MTADEYKRNLREARLRLAAERPREALRITLDLMALVKLRIQTSGRDSNERRFAPYTGQYAKYGRQRKGYQSQYVDFTRTGRLWASVVPRVARNTSAATEILVAPRDAENAAKLAGQVAKRGNILIPTEQELEAARAANLERIARIFQNLDR